MAKVTGLGHASFTVMDLDRTIEFYVNKLGGRLLDKTKDEGPTLGTCVFGTCNNLHSRNIIPIRLKKPYR